MGFHLLRQTVAGTESKPRGRSSLEKRIEGWVVKGLAKHPILASERNHELAGQRGARPMGNRYRLNQGRDRLQFRPEDHTREAAGNLILMPWNRVVGGVGRQCRSWRRRNCFIGGGGTS